MRDDNKRTIEVIGYDSGWGCGDFRCEDGPRELRADQIMQQLAVSGYHTDWRGPLGLKFLGDHKLLDTKEKTLPLVRESLARLAQATREALDAGRLPLVIGGDHSSAIGTWSGVTSALGAEQNFGLLWVDAHLDSHTYETSHQGKFGGWWHGQPVAALLGHGLPELVSTYGNKIKLSPQHLAMVGIHSFEPAEEAFVKKHNIKVFYLDEVRQRGFKTVFKEALSHVTAGTKGFGMTLDLDAFRPADAPGVGAAEDKGLVASEVLPIIKALARHPDFKALEIVEFNPHKDIHHKTRALLEKIIAGVFSETAE